MSRIVVSDELVEGLANMSEGNPGALSVLMQYDIEDMMMMTL